MTFQLLLLNFLVWHWSTTFHHNWVHQSHWWQFYHPTVQSISSLPLRSTWHGWPIIPSVKIPLLAFLPDIMFCLLPSASLPPLFAFLPSVCLYVQLGMDLVLRPSWYPFTQLDALTLHLFLLALAYWWQANSCLQTGSCLWTLDPEIISNNTPFHLLLLPVFSKLLLIRN